MAGSTRAFRRLGRCSARSCGSQKPVPELDVLRRLEKRAFLSKARFYPRSWPINGLARITIAHLPFSTHDSSVFRDCPVVSSAHWVTILACTLVCFHASRVKPLICACVLLMIGIFFSYSQLKSAIFFIVTGISNQPAVIPTAKGKVARSSIPRFLVMIVPPKVATRTYIAPGSNCSPVSGEGAKEAIVFVKDVSCLKAHDITELTPLSAAND